MPTIITHAIVGLGAGKVAFVRKLPIRFWVLSAVLPALPDLDVLAFRFGIPYAHFFGHRGFFHSLPFALVMALLVMVVFFRSERFLSRRWLGMLAYFFVIAALHGVFDAFTSGGLGIALLSPFDTTRYFFWSQPIEVAPLGIRAFFSEWGVRVMLSEILWVWLPLVVIVGMTILIRRMRRPTVS